MAIQKGDVKLIKSETMLDTSDGGGRMAKVSTNEIVDGVSNNMFPDISELDRTYGRIALRKVYAAVLTPTTDSYMGSHALISDVPKDPKVSTVLFSTKSWTDTRQDAQNRIEQYLAPSSRWPGHLLETQLEGARAIQILLKPKDALPEVGRTLYLVQDEDKAQQIYQYVRVTKISAVEKEFTHTNGTKWLGVVVTITISDPLRYTFYGIAPTPYEAEMANARAKARDTIVADAAKYYSTMPIIEQADLGDFSVKASAIYGQLVPSAQTEIPLVDLDTAGQSQAVIQSGDNEVVYTIAYAFGAGKQLYLGTGCKPGTLNITNGSATITDAASKIYAGGEAIGTIDYAQGILTFSVGAYSGSSTVKFYPAAAPIRVVQTAALKVGQNDRGYTWTINLNPPPPPGSLIISYRAQGRWYDLRDQGPLDGSGGVGQVAGSESAIGTGSVNYVTGSVVLTCGALPDADSEILFFWATASNFFNRSSRAVQAPYYKFQLEHEGIIPGTCTLTWPNPLAAGNLTVTDNGKGVFSNANGTGTIRYQTGEIKFSPAKIMLAGSTLTFDYAWGDKDELTFNSPVRDGLGKLNITIPGGNLIPGTLEVEFNSGYVDYDVVSTEPMGTQLMSSSNPIATTVIEPDVPTDALTGKVKGRETSAITYSGGTISFNPDGYVSIPKPQYASTFIGFQTKDVSVPVATRRYGMLDGGGGGGGGDVGAPAWSNEPQGTVRQTVKGAAMYRNTLTGVTYQKVALLFPTDGTGFVKVRFLQTQSGNVVQEQMVIGNLNIDLTDQYNEKLVTGSTRFKFGTKTYVDRVGQLYTDIDPETGAGTLAGTINYANGSVGLTIFPTGTDNVITMQSLLTEQGNNPCDYLIFRVPTSPIRSGSFQLRGTRTDGTTFNIVAQTNGKLAGEDIAGNIDYLTGIVEVRFGGVTDATYLHNARYYLPGEAEDGQIFVPRPVWVDTLRYNAVSYTYLPLDASILGLDPVRLPPDGKVPIYRSGDVAVVHHTGKMALPNNPAPGYQMSVGRVRLAYIKLVDSMGVTADQALYTVDQDAGTLKLADNFTIGALVQPLYAEHRIEDMGLVSDVQINGVLTFTRPITHTYPANESKVSSALVIGDLQSSVNRLVFFTQQTWNSTWSDSRSGSGTTAQYNSALSPIAVSNVGAIKERWAIIFDSTTTFRVVGESVGQIATGSIGSACAPVNPATNAPYFQINPEGWGTGWASGNCLRFNTYSANFPLWVARTVLQGAPTVFDTDGDGEDDADGFVLQIRGDIDNP